MVVLLMFLLLALTVLGPAALYQSVRHGPLRHPWWDGETLTGFACTTTLAFAFVGVAIGGLVPKGGNLLPGLLMAAGAVIGGAVGIVWGWHRARARAELA